MYTRVVGKMVELVSLPFNLLTSRDMPIWDINFCIGCRRLAENYVKARKTARKSCLGISWFVSLSVETFSFYKFSYASEMKVERNVFKRIRVLC